MKVIRAARLGMCFGVRDAIDAARAVPGPSNVAIHGELVHNPQVLDELSRRGFTIGVETNRGSVPMQPRVMITAHGISDRERDRLLRAGKELIDTTCPLVHRVHGAAQALQAQGWFVVVVGRRGHVEVQGIIGDLQRYIVVQSADEATNYREPRIGIVCQTTTPPTMAREIHKAIVACNPDSEIRFVDTVCHPTRSRQEALLDLLPQVDALVVVGGRHSHNTRQLGNLAASRGTPWTQVESAADLDPGWLARFHTVGLTAGTSTPDPVIREVEDALRAFDPSALVVEKGVP